MTLTAPLPPKKKRKKMSVSPTRRTLAWLRSHGYVADVVEQTLPRCFIKRDLFGVFDIVAVKPGAPILAVQTTSTRTAERTVKIEESAPARDWLSAGGAIEVHGWVQTPIAPQPGVKRTTKAAFEYRLRLITARLEGGVVKWSEEEAQ